MFDTGCRSDLLHLDGLPRAIRVRGSSRDALAGRPLVVENCGEPIHLDAGNHRISTAPGRLTGLALDRLVASSDPTEIAPVAELPTLRILEETRTSYDIEVVEARAVLADLGPEPQQRWAPHGADWDSGRRSPPS